MLARATAKAQRHTADESKAQTLRRDFIPKDTYLSNDFLQKENEKLWPKAWQIACRIEEIQLIKKLNLVIDAKHLKEFG